MVTKQDKTKRTDAPSKRAERTENSSRATELTENNSQAQRPKDAQKNALLSSSSFFNMQQIPRIALAVSGLLVALVMIIGFSSSDTVSDSTIAELTRGMEVLSTYSGTSESSNDDRNENLKLASAAINGIKIENGRQFSFNNAVGNTSQDLRYKEAVTIDGTTETTTVGGGVCQVSSVLYIAALEAGLEIVERHPHTVAQDYVPLGLDATVWYDELDFVIKNTTGHPIVIEAKQSGATVTITIYGTPFSDETRKANSVIEYTSKTKDSAGETIIEYTVNSYLLTYDEDDECIKREVLDTDVYVSTPDFVPEARDLEGQNYQ